MKDMFFERIIAFIMGVILAGIFLNGFWGVTITTWPTTEGHVVTSFVKKGLLYNETVIEYSYKVDNKEYHSTDLKDVFRHHYEFSYQRALNLISHYPIGKEVNVFYDSHIPEKATLNLYLGPTIEEGFRYLMFITIICLFAFSFGWVGMYRNTNTEVKFIAEDFRSKSREKF